MPDPEDGRVIIDQSGVYSSLYGNIKRVPKSGGTITTLVNTGTVQANIVSDGASVYYFNTATNNIESMPVMGGVPTIITPAPGFDEMAVSGNSLYWSDGNKNIWKVTVPEPGSALLYVVGALSIFLRRR